MADKYTTAKALVEAKVRERDDVIKESWVKAMEARLVQQQLEKCHRAEGVNHYENCKWLQELYLNKMDNSRVKGWKKVDI